MKTVFTTLSLLLAFSFSSFADHHEGGDMMDMKGKKFEEAKKMMSEHLDKKMEHANKRIGHLKEMKTCVDGASDKEALKACRKKHKEVMKEHRKTAKEHREMRKEMRQKRKASRKAREEG